MIDTPDTPEKSEKSEKPAFEKKDLKELIETRGEILRDLRNEVTEMEKIQKDALAVTTKNALLKKVTKELQMTFLKSMSGGRIFAERRQAQMLADVFKQDLEKIRLRKTSAVKKSQ